MGSFGGRHWSRPGAAHLPELGGTVSELAAEDACSSCSSVEAFSLLLALAHGFDMPFVHFWWVVNLDVPLYNENERLHFYLPSLELLVAHFGDWSCHAFSLLGLP